MKKFKKAMALVLATLTVAGMAIPTFATGQNDNSINAVMIEHNEDSKSKSIIVSEEYLDQFMDSFKDSDNDAVKDYMDKTTFTQWQNQFEKGLKACSHSWGSNAVDTGRDLYNFTNDENSYCYRVESMFQRQCTISNCGAIQFFTIWEYDENHVWSNRVCNNYHGADKCRAIR